MNDNGVKVFKAETKGLSAYTRQFVECTGSTGLKRKNVEMSNNSYFLLRSYTFATDILANSQESNQRASFVESAETVAGKTVECPLVERRQTGTALKEGENRLF